MSGKAKKGKFRFWLISILSIIAILAVVIIGVWAYFFDHYIHPGRMQLDVTPEKYGLEFRDISFITADKLTLNGWFILPPEEKRSKKMPLIIAFHGYGTNRGDILERISYMANAGFAVFTYDHRGSGTSEGTDVSGGTLEIEDARLAVNLALRQADVDVNYVAVYGFSMGAVVAINAAAQDTRIKAVVADSPFSSTAAITRKILEDNNLPEWPFYDLFAFSYKQAFGKSLDTVDTVEAAKSLKPRPFLLLAGDADQTVPLEHAVRIYAAAGEPKEFALFNGHDHEDNGSKEIFENRIIPFLVKYVMPEEENLETIPPSENAAPPILQQLEQDGDENENTSEGSSEEEINS